MRENRRKPALVSGQKPWVQTAYPGEIDIIHENSQENRSFIEKNWNREDETDKENGKMNKKTVIACKNRRNFPWA